MLSYIMNWRLSFESPLILFVVLLFITHMIYYFLFRRMVPSVASGSIVMAIGIIAYHSLPPFHLPARLMLGIALELFIIWFYLGVTLLQSYLERNSLSHHLSDRIYLGTWVAGTVIVAILLYQVEDTLHGFIVLLGIIALMLWVVYLIFIIKWFLFYLKKQSHMPVSGGILLATVSTQSIVILLSQLFHEHIPAFIYQVFILLGCVFYGMGFVMILRYFCFVRRNHFLAVWPNVNCIMHGAIAITGYALLNTQVYPDWVAVLTWYSCFVMFLMVEFFELCRLMLRIQCKGLKHGLLIYHISQWSRLFTFGMFYSFTFIYSEQAISKSVLVTSIARHGQYITTGLLLIEILLLCVYLFNRVEHSH